MFVTQNKEYMDINAGNKVRIDMAAFAEKFLERAHDDLDKSTNPAAVYMRENKIHEMNEAFMALLQTPLFADADPIVVSTAISMLSETFTRQTQVDVLRAKFTN